MKISIKKNFVRFSEIKKGDVFALDGEIYMRIDNITNKQSMVLRAVNLKNGNTYSMYDDENVELLPNAELVCSCLTDEQ